MHKPSIIEIESGREGVEEFVGRIANMDLEALRHAWSQRYGSPPALRSIPILRMLLAWRVQAEAYGGIDDEGNKVLARKSNVQAEGQHLGIGARLTRNWKGQPVEVVVERNGFRWNDKIFPSLSAAATAIAGSKWNGPRFFGLRTEA